MTRDEAEHIGNELANTFNNFEFLDFYIKCAYHITEGRLRYLVETARTKRSPSKYFSAAANKEMRSHRCFIT